ncbi:hypothetical protein B0G93_11857 [Bacillus sp. V-88]|nr:hypothetical protein B0G93_11857 [Bacillus sp. V-88]SLK24014.1 hypothetical protein SAMN06295884_11857 [Bacillus sp. V-88]
MDRFEVIGQQIVTPKLESIRSKEIRRLTSLFVLEYKLFATYKRICTRKTYISEGVVLEAANAVKAFSI